MEKKKLLLVAISVGVFLVIIISAALLIFTPKNGIGNGTAFTSGRPIAAGTTGILPPEQAYSQPETPPETPPARTPPPAASHTANQESNVYIAGDKPIENSKPAGKTEQSPGQVTVNIVKPSAPAVSDTPPAAAKPPAAASKPAAAPKPAAPAAAAAPKPAAKGTPKPATAAAKPANAPATPRKSDYWVQTGAFSTQVRAEGAKETLAGKGITSIIENRQVDGKLWYRVRVGPYTSETEANYWLALVKSIDGFGESQVRQTLR